MYSKSHLNLLKGCIACEDLDALDTGEYNNLQVACINRYYVLCPKQAIDSSVFFTEINEVVNARYLLCNSSHYYREGSLY